MWKTLAGIQSDFQRNVVRQILDGRRMNFYLTFPKPSIPLFMLGPRILWDNLPTNIVN